MPKNTQSIEDLLGGSGSGDGDEDTQSQFTQKAKEIKIKEIERATQKQAALLGAPYVDLSSFAISPDALSLIEEEDARRMSVVCFFYDGKNIRLATTDYENKEASAVLEKFKNKYYTEVELYLISDHSLERALDLYKSIPKPRKIIKGIEISETDLNKYSDQFASFKDIQAQIDNTVQVSDMVTIIMAAAVKINSSDVHIEVEEKSIKVRFRIDGVLHDAAVLRKEIWDKIILRFKVLTRVKINISNKPQDGRMSIFLNKERIDIRASFLPTNYGESIVLRFLRSSAVGLEFDDLGLRGRAFDGMRKAIERPNGMIITAGPTGSGKTTTLYAILKKLNKPETKIITIEDPIEYQLDGVNQSQVGEKYTFAQGLRSIVRQDPDILMVGEIRDLETAEISIQAALTGHLVLSTIHTNDASGTVPRFLSMGAKPFLLAPALNVMIGQRLVRRICKSCKEEFELDSEAAESVKNILSKLPAEETEILAKKMGQLGENFNLNALKFFKGKGCEACQGIGYKGRIGIYEVMPMGKSVEELILSGKVSEYDMREIALKSGMINMAQDGLLKALDGITSVEEIFRVAEMKE
jgi:type IV pilus assembly protein PilB